MLHVVVFVEEFHQLHDLLRRLAFDLDVVLRNHRNFGSDHFYVLSLDRVLHAFETFQRCIDFVHRFIALEIIRACFDRERHQGFFIGLRFLDGDVALLRKHPCNRAGLAHSYRPGPGGCLGDGGAVLRVGR